MFVPWKTATVVNIQTITLTTYTEEDNWGVSDYLCEGFEN